MAHQCLVPGCLNRNLFLEWFPTSLAVRPPGEKCTLESVEPSMLTLGGIRSCPSGYSPSKGHCLDSRASFEEVYSVRRLVADSEGIDLMLTCV